MSSNAPTSAEVSKRPLHRYFVFAPDCTDADALRRRYEVREQHLAGVAHILNKSLKVGGMLIAPGTENKEGQRQAVGSIIIMDAESQEEVEKLVKSDIYYTSRTWDPEKVVIYPFIPATEWP